MSDQPDQRPRPQYGEYATPEEQRARMARPDATASLAAGLSPGSQPQPVVPASTWVPPVAQASPAPQAGSPGVRPVGVAGTPHPVDRIATLALLAYGAINVVFSAVSFFQLPDVAAQAMRILGIDGEFTNVDAARLWGPIAAAVLAIGYLLTAWLSWRRLRTGRITWWVPLVGAFATYVVVYVCLAVPLLGDPAFLQYTGSR